MASDRAYIRERQQTAKKQKQNRLAAVVLIGIGLMIFSAALMIYLKPVLEQKASEFGGNTGDSETGLPPLNSVVPATVNFPAPELSLNTLDGRQYALADYHGQVVLVNNWAVWCPPCKAELPHLEEFYQRHKAEQFTIVGIEAGDDVTQVKNFVGGVGLSFPIWLDPRQEALTAFRNDSLPSSYVIDKSGQVRLAWTGPINVDMLESYVTPLLSE